MNCLADTSYVLSVAGDDVHTKRAAEFLAKHSGPDLRTTGLVLFECRNRLQKWQLAGDLSEADHLRIGLHVDSLISRRFIHLSEVTLRRLHAEARRLIEHFSSKVPHGTMDVLHLAAAVALRCDSFCTFDKNQRALAVAAGLKVLPA